MLFELTTMRNVIDNAIRPGVLGGIGLIGWMLAMAGCIPAGQNSPVVGSGPAGAVFPEILGVNLEGEEIPLPTGFAGELNLVAVAFEQDQQQFVDTWIEAINELVAVSPGLRFYEVPTIYEAGPAFRFWVNNGMRSGIRDPVSRERTITVYLDRERFNELLAIPDMSDIHVFLLDGAGRILWRTTGPLDEKKSASLEDVLASYS